MHPLIIVTINGRSISSGGFFMSQLISLSLTDKQGHGSDTVDLVFNASRFMSVPRKKDQIKVWMGYQESGTVYFGSFDVIDAELRCIPYTISVSAKASDMKSDLKTNQSRHFDDTTMGDVFTKLAKENGLEPVISGKAASFKDTFFNMEDESLLHFGDRMGRKHDALFDIKDGKLIFTDKGTGLSASGQSMTPLIITPEITVVGSCSFKFTGRDSHKQVEAQWHDKAKATRKIVQAPSDEKGEGTLRLKHAFANEAEAKSAANAKAKDLKRKSISASVDIIGTGLARGGRPMIFEGFHPEANSLPFIIDTASHNYSKDSGWLASLTGELKV